ncbi:MAG: hypothetical protein AAGJ87_03795 [Pseudomonadota bacterium]
MGSLKEVARFWTPTEAYCAAGYLNAFGIETQLRHDHHLTVDPALRFALGGIPILVFAEDADHARACLDEVDENESERETSGRKTDRKSLQFWLWALVAFYYAEPFIPRGRSRWRQLLATLLLLPVFISVFLHRLGLAILEKLYV